MFIYSLCPRSKYDVVDCRKSSVAFNVNSLTKTD